MSSLCDLNFVNVAGSTSTPMQVDTVLFPRLHIPSMISPGSKGRTSDLGLPEELLADIFAYLPFQARITATHVCRTWRHVSLGWPALLWSNIKSSHHALPMLLDRSAGTPVTLRVAVNNSNAEEVAAGLRSHLHHVRSLNMRLKGDLALSKARIISTALSGTPAPILERVVLFDHEDLLGRAGCGPGGLFPCSPRLGTLKVFHRDMPIIGCRALGNVRHLLTSPCHGGMTVAQYRELLVACPQLETLGLELGAYPLEAEWHARRTAGLPLPVPASLERIAITVDSGDYSPGGFDPVDVVRAIDLTGVQHVCLSFNLPDFTTRRVNQSVLDWVFAGQTGSNKFHGNSPFDTTHDPVVSILVDSSNYSSLSLLEANTASGRRLDLLDVRLDFAFDSLRLARSGPSYGAFAHLRTLAVSVCEWATITNSEFALQGQSSPRDAICWPHAPVLEQLIMRLVLPRYLMQDFTARDILLDPKPWKPTPGSRPASPHRPTSPYARSAALNSRTPAGTILKCPKLQQLIFSTRGKGDPDNCGFAPTLAPETIREFMEWQLDLGTTPDAGEVKQRKPLLVLNGIALLTNNVDEVAKLLGVVSDVETGLGHLPMSSPVAHLLEW